MQFHSALYADLVNKHKYHRMAVLWNVENVALKCWVLQWIPGIRTVTSAFVWPFGPHLCFGGPQGLPKLLCCQRPHKKSRKQILWGQMPARTFCTLGNHLSVVHEIHAVICCCPSIVARAEFWRILSCAASGCTTTLRGPLGFLSEGAKWTCVAVRPLKMSFVSYFDGKYVISGNTVQLLHSGLVARIATTTTLLLLPIQRALTHYNSLPAKMPYGLTGSTRMCLGHGLWLKIQYSKYNTHPEYFMFFGDSNLASSNNPL